MPCEHSVAIHFCRLRRVFLCDPLHVRRFAGFFFVGRVARRRVRRCLVALRVFAAVPPRILHFQARHAWYPGVARLRFTICRAKEPTSRQHASAFRMRFMRRSSVFSRSFCIVPRSRNRRLLCGASSTLPSANDCDASRS